MQLQRIEQDQAGNLADPGDHATANSLYAETWESLARGGVAARWTLDEHQRLVASGWSPAQAKAVANIVFNLQNGGAISSDQMSAYGAAFGIPVTADIFPSRACRGHAQHADVVQSSFTNPAALEWR